MLMYSVAENVACFEHSNFFKVNDLGPREAGGTDSEVPPAPTLVPTPLAGTRIQKEGTGAGGRGRAGRRSPSSPARPGA